MPNSSLVGVSENQKDILASIKFLEPLLPCSKRKAIADLHFRTGHTTRYCREEIIEPLIDASFLLDDGLNISLPNGSKNIDMGIRDVTPQKKAHYQNRRNQRSMWSHHLFM